MPLNTFIQSTLGWELKAETLDFFQEFKTRDEAGFFELFDLLNQYCREEGLFLKGHHIDAVVDILLKQQRLPEDIEYQLKNHLQFRDPDGQNIRCLIERLRTERLPWLTVQARDNFYSHHTMYHSSEIKIRTSRAAEHLGLFVTKNPEETHYLRDQFLRPIFRLAVECHDFIQGKPGSAALGSYPTAEMASAAQVKQWLFSSLDLPEGIRLLLDLAVDNAIPLATTLLFNKNKDKPRHLFDIYSLVEEKTQARLKATSDRSISSKQALLNEIQAMNIVISTCDLFPSSIRVVVQRQREQKQTDSLSNLNANFGEDRLLLGKFFAGGSFSRYFSEGPMEDDFEVIFNDKHTPC